MLILDFYVDEPACFGVPPYISPYCRYTAGALVSAGVPPEKISYLTVDQWRAQSKDLPEEELLFLVAGHTVPGKYLGGKIGSFRELLEVLEYRKKYHKKALTILGGPIRYAASALKEQIEDLGAVLVRGDLELYAWYLARQSMAGRSALVKKWRSNKCLLGERRNYEQIKSWAPAGAFLTNLHPNFPYLMIELESYRGCTRNVFCSFCTEAFYGKAEFRSLQSIKEETQELYAMGNRFFRLGRQADLMTYLPDMRFFQSTFPRPIPEHIARLYSVIRQAAPGLEVLHLDNINPGLIAAFPKEAREIIRIISANNTVADTAAMGLESVDPHVIELNQLKCNEEQAMQAIEIVNEFGAQRSKGLPKLLPGINLIHGLPGENAMSFERNYAFLKQVAQRGLLLRRINIRKVVSYAHTKLEELQKKQIRSTHISIKQQRKQIIEQKFHYWSKRIRQEIDQPMLLLNFPLGSIIAKVIPELQNHAYIFGRPLGSYPITMKISLGDQRAFKLWQAAQNAQGREKTMNVIVMGAMERSLLGLHHPIGVFELTAKAWESIPGIAKARATELFLNPPRSYEELQNRTEGRALGKESDYDFQPLTYAKAAPMRQNAAHSAAQYAQRGCDREWR